MATSLTARRRVLFGAEHEWHEKDWTASDDRVRGGKSQSFLDCTAEAATFYGTLDITALGGAGFASQRTTGDDRNWDLSDYDGIELTLADADQKQYTFILKDELLPQNPDSNREQSTISYEHDFCAYDSVVGTKSESIFIPWKAFKARYRGREQDDAPTMNTKQIKRMSFMMRSFFGTQQGEFKLKIVSIAVVTGGQMLATASL